MLYGCRKCRREGEKLMLKGERCLSPKCAVVKRPYAPGQHGPNQRIKLSEYGKQLREKQKARKIFGVSEAVLSKYYVESDKALGNTAENLLVALETRIDSILYHVGIAPSQAAARQLASHGKVNLNGKRITTPSIRVKPDDVISFNKVAIDDNVGKNLPTWLAFDQKKAEIKINHLPTRDEIDAGINENLIVEFYSR